MKALLILFILLFSFSVFADEKFTSYYDENSIYEIHLIIEEDEECSIKQSEIETEIKYVLSNSNIRIKNRSEKLTHYLWVQPTYFNVKLNKNICFVSINYNFYSKSSDSSRILLWRENSISVSEYPWKDYFLGSVNKYIKEFVIWINENR